VNVIAVVFVALSLSATVETRYCYAPADVPRYEDGTIKRSSWVREKFRTQHPCPATGVTTGSCPGWAVDHIVPLVCGGCDAVSNMQWLPNTIKSCAGTECKDRWEQRVYCPVDGAVQ
jgi:hypothetical protein